MIQRLGLGLDNLRRASSFAWTIPQEASLIAWFDPAYGITKDGSNNISSWASRSGSVTATQGTGANQPLYVASGYNGRPTVQFDHTSSEYLGLGVQLSAYSNNTCIVVFKTTDVNTFQTVFGGGNAAGSWINTMFNVIVKQTNNGDVGYAFGDTGNASWGRTSTGSQISNNTLYTVAQTHPAGQNFQDIFLNGTTKTLTKDSTLVTNPTSNASSPHSIGRFGAFNGAYFRGDIAMILCWQTALGTSDRQSIESQLRTYFGHY